MQMESPAVQTALTQKWKEVELNFDFPYRLAISNFGNAKLFETHPKDGKFLKVSYANGRSYLTLTHQNKKEDGATFKFKHRFNFHVLMAKTFLPNPDNLKFVAHIDGNITNNHVENLRWSKFRLAGVKTPKEGKEIKLESTEKAAVFFIDELAKRQYAITNFGKVILFFKELSDGRYIVPYIDNKGRDMITIQPLKEKRKSLNIHKLVATYFLPKPTLDQKYVIHIDGDQRNNNFLNLSWATQTEKTKRARDKRDSLDKKGVAKLGMSQKLTLSQVVHIKRLIQRGKMRNKMIAKQFGISEMAIYRIKRGENWGHVTLENK